MKARRRLGGLAGLVLAVCWSVGAYAGPRRDAIVQFDVLMRTLNYEQALTVAQQLLDSAKTEQPPRPQDVVEAHTLMGRAQLALQNTAAAETSFNAALKLAEQQLGPSSARLIEPLTELGLMYARLQRHDEAVATLERALVLTRRNAGLYDIAQARILKQLIESYTMLGGVVNAQQHVEYLRGVAEHVYGAADARVVPTLCDVADWYSRVGDGQNARLLYRRAIDIVETRRGNTAVELVAPLQGLARSYTRELTMPRAVDPRRRDSFEMGFGPSPFPDDDDLDPRIAGPAGLNGEGENALRRAVQVLERPPQNPEALRDALIVLADWYQIKQDERRALPLYARATSLTTPDDATLLESPVSMQTPVLLYYPPPLGAMRYAGRPPSTLEAHFVLVEFTVNVNGDVDHPTVVESDASDRHVKQTLASLNKARYRPRFVDGAPASTDHVRYRQIFMTPKKEVSPAPEPPAAAPAAVSQVPPK